MDKKILFLVFGVSGATALMYEIIWSRSLQLLLGSTIYTVSIVFSTFLLGFSLGSYFLRNIADKTKTPLIYLMSIEIAIGFYGILMIGILILLSKIYLLLPSSLIFRAVISFLILLPPTFLFGSIWPLIHKYHIENPEKIGKGAGYLYSVNSLGSGLGAFAGGFILIPLIGLTKTSIVIALLNIFAAGLIFILYKKDQNKIKSGIIEASQEENSDKSIEKNEK